MLTAAALADRAAYRARREARARAIAADYMMRALLDMGYRVELRRTPDNPEPLMLVR